MKIQLAALWLAVAASPTSAFAQLKCTMPNGVTITRQIGDCPADAVRIIGPDGKQLPVKKKPPPNPKPTAQATTRSTAPEPAPAAPTEPSAYEYAGLICKALEQSGATTCDVNSNVFSTSTIEATLATSPSNAVVTCKELAAIMRSKTRAFEAKEWKILIFSPFSGNRPIATCRL